MNETVPRPKTGWKALFCTFANMVVQAMDVNRLHQTLAGCELVVVVDHQMTDTATWADIVLPATMPMREHEARGACRGGVLTGGGRTVAAERVAGPERAVHPERAAQQRPEAPLEHGAPPQVLRGR